MAELVDENTHTQDMDASQAVLDSVRAHQVLPDTFAAGGFLPLAQMRDCLLPDNHPEAPTLKNGVATAADGTIHVATVVEFPGVSPLAFAWWFAEGCSGDEEYQTWHPEDHLSGHFVEGTSFEASGGAEQSHEEPWVGREHVVVEALGAQFGGRLQSLRIKFCSPNVYGIDRADLQAANCDVILTARVCVRDPGLGWLDVGHFVHFTQPLTGGVGGFELRSRFWLGDVYLPPEASIVKRVLSTVVTLAANNRVMRAMFARLIEGRSPLELAVANWRHATEEFSVLASFLASKHAKAVAGSKTEGTAAKS